MNTYLIYRHGSNAANQPMCDRAAVAIVDAHTTAEACKIASETQSARCYVNQHLVAIWEHDLDEDGVDDWNKLVESKEPTDGILPGL